MRKNCFRGALVLVLSCFLYSPITSQSVMVTEGGSPANAKLNRSRGLSMLDDVKSVLKERYYDKTFRGIDIDTRFKAAADRIKTMDTNAQIFRVIAQVVIEFDDSHTRFYPPGRANRVEYGFSMQMVGNNCFVTDVKKGSDAEKKGLKVGNLIVGVGQFIPTRENLWIINYLLYQLDPQSQIKILIVGPDKTERGLIIQSTFRSIEDRRKEADKRRKEKREEPYKCHPLDANTIACRLETFSVEKKFVDRMIKEASGHKNLILDLRGNGGGYVTTVERLISYFFDKEVTVGTTVARDKEKVRIAKPVKDGAYKGELIVLTDSDSASASEVFARVIQIEKRGRVVGDRTAGAVVTSNYISMANQRGVPGYETLSFFAMNVTVSDLIMSDGKRLEKIGVSPDHPVGPTGIALSTKSDPVLSFAAQLFGSTISSVDAGKFGFIREKIEDEEKEETEEAGN